MRTGCGNLYVTINEDKVGMFEIFAQLGKGGGCTAAQTEAISRLISQGLRCSIDPNIYIEELKGIRCARPIVGVGGVIQSCPDAISKAIETHLKSRESETDIMPAEQTLDSYVEEDVEDESDMESMAPMAGLCSVCGTPLVYQEGCQKCPACGDSKC
jgi:ribonucleoside-diphosphate reductase alpha chain